MVNEASNEASNEDATRAGTASGAGRTGSTAGSPEDGAARGAAAPPPPPPSHRHRDWGSDASYREAPRGASGAAYGGARRHAPSASRYDPEYRPPWIVGPTADSVIGFIAGFFGNVFGFIGAVIVMFLWADNAREAEDHLARRAHARAVSISAGIGCALPLLFSILVLMLVVGHAGVIGVP